LLAEPVKIRAMWLVALGSCWRKFFGFYVGLVKVFFQPQSRHEADLRFKSKLSLCEHTGHFISLLPAGWDG
jgi:hypothetical protein